MQNLKKHILLFVIIAIGFAMGIILIVRQVSGSDSQNEQKTLITQVGNIKFDSLTVDTTAVLSEADPKSKVTIHMVIMYAKDNEKINKSIASCGIFFPENINTDSLEIKDVARQFMRQYVEDYKADYRDIYAIEQGATPMTISYKVTTKIAEITDRSFAYVATVSQQNGGPHPINITYVRNIDTKTGAPLELDDIFVSGYHHKLKDKIINKMCKDQKVENLDSLQAKQLFVGTEAYPSKTFILGNNDITFIYNEDEIAPHDKGEIRVRITKEELQGILK